MSSKEIYIIERIKDIVKESKGRYGYRRVSKVLRLKYGLIVNHKKVLRIMKENGLLCKKFKNRVRKYNSYKGTVGKIAKNIVKIIQNIIHCRRIQCSSFIFDHLLLSSDHRA